MPRFCTYKKLKKEFNVSPTTLKTWAVNGQIDYRIIENKDRRTWLYDADSIGRITNDGEEKETEETKKQIRIAYARVSSSKQKEDLKRQVEFLKERFPYHEIYQDIGSGLNYNRPKFSKMVELICQGHVTEVAVAYKDRLLRFGWELFEQICIQHQVKLVVLYQKSDTEERELQDDLMSVITFFTARYHGKRSYKKRHNTENNSKLSLEDKIVPDKGAKEKIKTTL